MFVFKGRFEERRGTAPIPQHLTLHTQNQSSGKQWIITHTLQPLSCESEERFDPTLFSPSLPFLPWESRASLNPLHPHVELSTTYNHFDVHPSKSVCSFRWLPFASISRNSSKLWNTLNPSNTLPLGESTYLY